MSQGNKTILIVEDDQASRELLRMACAGGDYRVKTAETGEEALEMYREHRPDLVLLDINLPDISGRDVCRILRADGARCPIVIVSSNTDTIDVVVGLEIGADDYVRKPFQVREMAARIRGWLKRGEAMGKNEKMVLEFPGLSIDTSKRLVLRDSEEVKLTLTEFNLLALLASRDGTVVSRTELLRRVWGYEMEIETRTVDAHVYRLRRKIEPDGEEPYYIHSVPGIGYRFAGGEKPLVGRVQRVVASLEAAAVS